MSYRCHRCNVVCDHEQVKVVAERRRRHDQTWEIAREIDVCRPCAAELGVNVRVPVEAPANGAAHDPVTSNAPVVQEA